MSHTPAPWKAMRMNKTLIISTDENEIATIKASGYNSVLDSGTRSANAILISTAPEMLKVLEQTEKVIDKLIANGLRDSKVETVLADILNVILKAKGLE